MSEARTRARGGVWVVSLSKSDSLRLDPFDLSLTVPVPCLGQIASRDAFEGRTVGFGCRLNVKLDIHLST